MRTAALEVPSSRLGKHWMSPNAADLTRSLVDPELLPLLDLIPEVNLTEESLPLLRQGRFPLPKTPGAAEAVSLNTRHVSGPAGAPDVQVLVYRAHQASGLLPCIFHVHGGGYVSGSADSVTPLHQAMALQLDCMIVSVDYRLGPAARVADAGGDCYAALCWLFSQAGALGVDPQRIGVMGESAGGGLAAALALLTRDRGEHRLAFQHLIYPMLDDRTCTADDPHPHVGHFIWTPKMNRFGWSALLGQPPGSPGVSPYAAAARAQDLSNLPPTFISTGSLDLFLEEDLEYGRRLLRQGIPVELHVYPGGFHGFDFMAEASVSKAARRDSLAALRRFLHAGAQP